MLNQLLLDKNHMKLQDFLLARLIYLWALLNFELMVKITYRTNVAWSCVAMWSRRLSLLVYVLL
jgi:hypothetical protein